MAVEVAAQYGKQELSNLKTNAYSKAPFVGMYGGREGYYIIASHTILELDGNSLVLTFHQEAISSQCQLLIPISLAICHYSWPAYAIEAQWERVFTGRAS